MKTFSEAGNGMSSHFLLDIRGPFSYLASRHDDMQRPLTQAATIRVFEESDVEDALEFWSGIEGLGLTESDTPEEIRKFLGRNVGLSAVATTSTRKMVGTVLCGENGRAGAFYHLAVEAGYRNQGIGHQLVEFGLQRLAENGIPRCNIFVYNGNDTGNRFWLANGWIDPTTWRVLQKKIL